MTTTQTSSFYSALGEVVNVKDLGAIGDGVTDDTTAFQAAIDAADTRNCPVFVPAGAYLVNNLLLKSGTRILGTGWSSIIKQKTGATYGVSATPGSAGTSSAVDNFRNIELRDLKLLGTIATDGASEHLHLLNLNSVSDVLIENVFFEGWRGDGIYIGSSNAPATERHNERITIRKCYFDGVLKTGRNGISVIDCVGLVIDDCVFESCNTPGCIDIEPDHTFSYVRDIKIYNNRFLDTNGSGVQIWLAEQKLQTVPQSGFYIYNNHFESCGTGLMISVWGSEDTHTNGDTHYPLNAYFNNNIIKGISSPFYLHGCSGVTVEHNVFEECGQATVGGDPSNYSSGMPTSNTRVRHNRFILCGDFGLSTYALTVREVDGLWIEHNEFEDCGDGGAQAFPVLFVGDGTGPLGAVTFGGTRVYLRNNLVTTPTGKTVSYAFAKATNYTLNKDTSEDIGNVTLPATLHGASASFSFECRGSKMSAAPTTGTWSVGAIVYNSTPTAGGVLGWVCTSAGTPGTWKSFGGIAP